MPIELRGAAGRDPCPSGPGAKLDVPANRGVEPPAPAPLPWTSLTPVRTAGSRSVPPGAPHGWPCRQGRPTGGVHGVPARPDPATLPCSGLLASPLARTRRSFGCFVRFALTESRLTGHDGTDSLVRRRSRRSPHPPLDAPWSGSLTSVARVDDAPRQVRVLSGRRLFNIQHGLYADEMHGRTDRQHGTVSTRPAAGGRR